MATIDRQAERAVLEDIMWENSVLDEIRLEISDFYSEDYKVVYGCMQKLHERQEAIDITTLPYEIYKTGKFKLDEAVSIATDINHGCLAIDAREHANIVKDCSTAREVCDIAKQMVYRVNNSEENIKIINDALNRLDAVLQDNRNETIHHCKEPLDTLLTALGRCDNAEADGLLTSYVDFDDITGGLQKGTLNILAARPSMGKTALALNIAQRTASKEKKVLFFSLEMTQEELLSRIISIASGVTGDKLKNRKYLTEDDWNKMLPCEETISKYKLYIDDSGDERPMDIRKKAIEFQHQNGLDLIIIDHLQLMKGDTERKERYLVIGEITRALKKLAKELRIPILALSQLSRDVEKRQDKYPLLSDLRESGDIEQDADLVMFLHRDEYYNHNTDGQNIAELIIAKHRAGRCGTVNLYFDARTSSFRSLSKVHGMDAA